MGYSINGQSVSRQEWNNFWKDISEIYENCGETDYATNESSYECSFDYKAWKKFRKEFSKKKELTPEDIRKMLDRNGNGTGDANDICAINPDNFQALKKILWGYGFNLYDYALEESISKGYIADFNVGYAGSAWTDIQFVLSNLTYGIEKIDLDADPKQYFADKDLVLKIIEKGRSGQDDFVYEYFMEVVIGNLSSELAGDEDVVRALLENVPKTTVYWLLRERWDPSFDENKNLVLEIIEKCPKEYLVELILKLAPSLKKDSDIKETIARQDPKAFDKYQEKVRNLPMARVRLYYDGFVDDVESYKRLHPAIVDYPYVFQDAIEFLSPEQRRILDSMFEPDDLADLQTFLAAITEKYKIAFPTRFEYLGTAIEILKSTYLESADEIDGQPLCVMIMPTSDWNGAFATVHDSITNWQNLGYRVKYYEATKDYELEPSLDLATSVGANPASVILIGGHGDGETLALGGYDLGVMGREYYDDSRHLDTGDFDAGQIPLEKYLTRNSDGEITGDIFFESCFGGEGGAENPDNLVNSAAGMLPKGVRIHGFQLSTSTREFFRDADGNLFVQPWNGEEYVNDGKLPPKPDQIK